MPGALSYKPALMGIKQLLDIFLAKNLLYSRGNNRGLYKNFHKFFASLVTSNTYPRNQLLLSPGQVPDYLYFIDKGLARGFSFDDKKQKETTLFLWKEHSTVIIPETFFYRKPSPVYIEVIADSRIAGISWSQLSDFITKYPEASVIVQNLVLQFNEYENNRARQLSTLSAWERYLQLLHDFPTIEQQVSKEIIASYLNITPQSLSRMLRKNRHP